MQPSRSSPWFNVSSLNPYPQKNKHAIVIGGGIAGSQMAWHLCKNDWKVTLIERHASLAEEASGNLAGVISPKMTARPSPGESFYTESFKYTLKQLDKLSTLKQQLDWHPCGVLQLAHTAREQKRWQALKEREFKADFLQAIDSKKSDEVAGIPLQYKASWFPKAGWIKPKSFCDALSAHPLCHIISCTQAITIKRNEEQRIWQVVDNKGNIIESSKAIIIANGKDLNTFKQSAFLSGIPVMGQTSSASASAYSNKLKTVIGHDGYLTPGTNGRHIFGATFDRHFTDLISTNSADETNFKQLANYLPQLSDSLEQIKSSHAAIRFTTPDRFPYAGPLPNLDFYTNSYADLHMGKHWKTYPSAQYQKGLYVLGGFGSRGLTTAGLCAKLLASIIDNRIETLSDSEKTLLNTLHPARFIIKNMRRNKVTQHTGINDDNKKI